MTTRKVNLHIVNDDDDYEIVVPDSARQYKAFYAELNSANSIEELRDKVLEIVNEIGFSDFLFMRLERSWQTDSRHGLLYSLPEELMRVYLEGNMHRNDLLISYSRVNTQPIFSSQIYGYINEAPFDIILTRNNRQLLQLYWRFHYFDHYVIPVPAINGSGNVQLILTSSNVDQHEFRNLVTPVMSISRVLCKAIDAVSTKKFRHSFIDFRDNPVKITPKPLQILHELANSDISITDLAEEMSISPITAHQHISAARKALGATTNIGAVIKAIRTGLIHIE